MSNLTGAAKFCVNCLRHTVPDVIKGLKCTSSYGVLQSIPAFVVCSWCGWVVDELEDAL